MLLGSQEPTFCIEPESASSEDADKAIRLARAYYASPDEWQSRLLGVWLARNRAGKWASRRCGLLMPRQNGKTALLGMRELYGAFCLGEHILHSSHQQKTSRRSFDEMADIVTSGDLANSVRLVRAAIGREAIRFNDWRDDAGVLHPGGSIEYVSRSRGGGRGFTADCVIVDESQELTDEHLESLMPTLSSAPLKNPQMILAGTPPAPTSPGDVFGRMRAEAAEGEADSLAWHEWSIDAPNDEAIHDRRIWARCNPAFGGRLNEGVIEAEVAQMTIDGFARERLGWWPETAISTAIRPGAWEQAKTDKPPAEGTPAYCVKFSNQQATVSLAVCLKPPSGPPHVEVIAIRPLADGLVWLEQWLAERWRQSSGIVLDGMQGAPMLAERMKSTIPAKNVLRIASAKDVIVASSMMLDAVSTANITHYGQDALNVAVTRAKRRNIGSNGGWGFGSIDGTDISPLEAVSLAHWLALTSKRDPTRKGLVG